MKAFSRVDGCAVGEDPEDALHRIGTGVHVDNRRLNTSDLHGLDG